LNALAVAGGLVCAGQVILWSTMGAWPFHDTAAYWLGGLHLREGAPVYAEPGGYLSFLYSPPWAVIWAGLSFLPLYPVTAGLMVLQILALRYVAGSWRNAGLLAWLPIVPRELVTGNIDLLIAATIYAAVRSRAGFAVALFSFAKWSPAATLVIGTRRQWRDVIVTSLVLVAVTIPWLHLWPEYFGLLTAGQGPNDTLLPLLPRIPVAIVLLAYRRTWSVAAGAALVTPAFYFHSLVLLIPAVRLAVEDRAEHSQTAEDTPPPILDQPVGTIVQ
jgi:hypothetical protein